MKVFNVGTVDLTTAAPDGRHEGLMQFFREAHQACAHNGISYGFLAALPEQCAQVGMGTDRDVVEQFVRDTYPDALAVEIFMFGSLQ